MVLVTSYCTTSRCPVTLRAALTHQYTGRLFLIGLDDGCEQRESIHRTVGVERTAVPPAPRHLTMSPPTALPWEHLQPASCTRL